MDEGGILPSPVLNNHAVTPIQASKMTTASPMAAR